MVGSDAIQEITSESVVQGSLQRHESSQEDEPKPVLSKQQQEEVNPLSVLPQFMTDLSNIPRSSQL